MSLIIVRHEEPKAPLKGKFSWDAWYAKNKQRLSVKRAKRYQTDVAYREAALRRGRAQRKKAPVVVTDGYTVSVVEAAHALGITVWTLREWRRKNYFPEPQRRQRQLWFTPYQVALLQRLRVFFDTHGIRVASEVKPALSDVVSLVYSNWS
jgi:hypothetical protein